MNRKQRDNAAKMFYDLVKVPLAVCCFGSVVAENTSMIGFIVFGIGFSVLFFYIGYTLDNKL